MCGVVGFTHKQSLRAAEVDNDTVGINNAPDPANNQRAQGGIGVGASSSVADSVVNSSIRSVNICPILSDAVHPLCLSSRGDVPPYSSGGRLTGGRLE